MITGWSWGEEFPTDGEKVNTWQELEMSAGNPNLRILNDDDWGLLILDADDEAVGPVVDMYAGTHFVEVTIDKYETGTGNREIYIRYSDISFGALDVTLDWELYTIAINKTCRYIQIKLKGL